MSLKKLIETPEQKAARETVERIAGTLSALAKSVQSLINGPLKRRALIILLASAAGETQTSVDRILRSLEDLEADWLNKK